MRDEKEARARELARRFEDCTLPLSDFKHSAHLTVALFYLTRMPASAAVEQFRVSIKRFIAHYGESGYNETITMFWLNLIAGFLLKSGPNRSFSDLLDTLLEGHRDSRLIYNYYTRERLQSDEAKTTWLAPDKAGMRAEG
ncbi:MAG TPA: hypothetical protein VF544_25495 [Pyrinomonadaceae bacterium]|jgi:hypothetical protein